MMSITFAYYTGLPPSFYNVFVVESYEAFRKQYEKISPSSHDVSGLYTIVFLELNSDVLKPMFEKLYQKRIINVIVMIASSEDKVQIYANFPYQRVHCGNIRPFVLAKFTNKSIAFEETLFSKLYIKHAGLFL